jgi:DNA-binding winged helix-turn-helix (wHTH) protein/TolB-like protein
MEAVSGRADEETAGPTVRRDPEIREGGGSTGGDVSPDPCDLFAFEDWTFEPASGELRRGEEPPVRLQPQPAQLLALLLYRAGEVVTRTEIIDDIWGHTTVEFDQAVNYCIRQIRIALGESATDSRYIDTLPRRGYRFLVPVTRSTGAPDPPRRGASRWPVSARWSAFALAAVVLGSVTLLPRGGPGAEGEAGPERPVIAVLVLRHAPDDRASGAAAVRIAEALTTALTSRTLDRYRIIGPTTTRPYGSDRAAIDRLRDELDAALVVGGSISTERSDGLFLELIDTRDGAHLWALTDDASDGAIVDLAVDSLDVRLAAYDSRLPH